MTGQTDGERMAEIAARLAAAVTEIGEIADRLRMRFPGNAEIEQAVERFLDDVRGIDQ